MLRTPVPASQLDDPAVVAAWRRPCAGSGMRVRCGPGTGCSSTGPARRRHYAVQIAAALGAEVTGVCSTRNAGLVRSIGAAHVVD
jgi:D-arabinose 1-dehydrogenase-like Zn-dependent alcohol dehydrogenase